MKTSALRKIRKKIIIGIIYYRAGKIKSLAPKKPLVRGAVFYP